MFVRLPRLKLFYTSTQFCTGWIWKLLRKTFVSKIKWQISKKHLSPIFFMKFFFLLHQCTCRKLFTLDANRSITFARLFLSGSIARHCGIRLKQWSNLAIAERGATGPLHSHHITLTADNSPTRRSVFNSQDQSVSSEAQWGRGGAVKLGSADWGLMWCDGV